MSPFVRVNPGDLIQAQNLNQVVGSLNGTSGQGVPITQTSVNDATNYALSVQNLEATNSRALNVLKSDGSLLIRADVNGVNLGNTTITGPTLTVPNGAIHNAALASDVARANLLTTGGFEIWQRGNGPFTGAVAGAWTADRWNAVTVGTDALSVSRDTTNVDNSLACAACTFTLGTGGGNTSLVQAFARAGEGLEQLKNKTVSVSVRVRTSTANAVKVVLFGTGGSSQSSTNHSGSGTYETLTATLAVGASATDVRVGIYFAASCTAYVDNANLVVGSQPADYVPLHPADDLARCLRYYELIGEGVGSGWVMGGTVATAASQAIWLTVPYKARKAVAPTVTKNGTWQVANCAQPTVWQSSSNDTILLATSSAAGAANFYANAAGQNLTIEANP